MFRPPEQLPRIRFTLVGHVNLILFFSQLFCAAPLIRIVVPESHAIRSSNKVATVWKQQQHFKKRRNAKMTFVAHGARMLHLMWTVAYAALMADTMFSGTPPFVRASVATVEAFVFFARSLCAWATVLLIGIGSQVKDE